MKAGILYLTTVEATVHAFLLPHIRALQQRGFRVEVACNLGRWGGRFGELGILAHHLPFQRRALSWGNIRAYSQLRRLLARRSYELVHVHTPVAAFWGRLAAHRAGVRTLYTAHGFHVSPEGNPLKNIFFLGMEKLAARWTDALIVINQVDRSLAERYKLIPPERLFHVRGVGVDIDKYKPGELSPEEEQDLKAGLGCAGKVVGMVGEFNPEKRHIDLLRAAELIWVEDPDVTFLLLGGGKLLSKLRRRMSSSAHKDKVKFLGPVPDVPRLLNIMDLFVLPSVREGLPRSLQEAMATGVPVVATDIRGNHDLVHHGRTGLLVPPRCPEQLAGAILKLLQDESLAQRLGERGRQLVASELALEKVLPQIVEIHDLLVAD